MSTYAIFVDGLTEVTDTMGAVSPEIIKAVRMAVNKGADFARAEAARRIGKQLNFSARYISGTGGKLTVTSRATGDNPSATIVAAGRPVSLARFAINRDPAAARKARGVAVGVRAGGAKFIPRAFLIKLKSGNSDELGNLGLAIRLRPGEQVENKRIKAKRMESNLYLLYGPSVSQAFINAAGGGVASDITPDILDRMEQEFLRLMKVELR